MKKRLSLIKVVALSLILGLVFAPFAAAKGETTEIYKAIIESMTLEERIGQMLLLGFPGTSLGRDAENLVIDLKAGGVVLFAANLTSVDQARSLTSSLQEAALKNRLQIPLLITADEEGGIVSRMPQGMVTFPGNMALGASRNEYLAYKAYYHMGRQLRSLGINMNLAPVLDVNSNLQNPVIGLRSFGADPYLVRSMGLASVDGLKDAGVGAILKHFPGHGDTLIDSHLALPILRKTPVQLEENEFLPFKSVINETEAAVMTGHISFPALTGGVSIPATLSKEILTGILRAGWGYEGVITTDDLLMNSIADYFGLTEAALLAVEAGADQLLLAGNFQKQKEVRDALVRAVKGGRISEKAIDRSVARILEMKADLGLFPGKEPDLLDPYLEAKEAEAVALEVALSATTLVKRAGKRIDLNSYPLQTLEVPLLVPGQKILLAGVDASLQGASGRGGKKLLELLKIELQKRDLDVFCNLSLSYRPTSAEKKAVLSEAEKADRIVFLSRNATSEQADLFRELTTSFPEIEIVSVSLQNPWDILMYPEAKNHLVIYGYTEAQIKALAMALSGEKKPLGRLPIPIWE